MFRKILRLVTSVAMLCLVACFDDNPSDASIDSPESSGTSVVSGESSSSVAESSSGDAGGSAANVASSSNENVAATSSSVIANSSSSAKAPKNTAACMWKGTDEYVPVKTGLDPDDKYGAGYWYNFGDSFKGGKSFIEFPINDDDQLNEWENIVRLIGECGGYCGAFVLDRGSANEAYAGFGFNVAGVEDPMKSNPIDGVREGDISDWGGVCVTYAADQDVYLELEADSAALYEVKLDKSIDFVEKCVTWNELNAVESSKHARSIRLKMKSTEKMTGHLTVSAIGKYDANGACEIDGHAEVLPKDNGPAAAYEGIIVLRSSSSGQCTEPKEVSEMWNGFASPLTTVETGLDNGTETSGYWFSFDDDMSGVGSVKLPQPLGIEYPTGDEIYDYCMGACGELQFAKEGYLGIGFHVAGVVDPLDGDLPAAKANISSWGGLCVTYASDTDLEVILAYTQEGGFGNLSRMPKMTLPKSIKLKTVCADWDNFMTVFSEVSTTFMTSILFAVQGEANTKSRINIRGLGKYSEKTNFCSPGDDPFVSGKLGLVIK
ncbi:hypothetical protein [Fibrobacter sp. UBA4309]|uniref:hypothetical protein n=1 Tax=Fibrobacter sp. UBA4309 TaxID=1946537 RepID=UPI0025C009D3|nr:hypothetical protein [Fibrobacter sp. UBA4309]